MNYNRVIKELVFKKRDSSKPLRVLSTYPRSGTDWLKNVIFYVMGKRALNRRLLEESKLISALENKASQCLIYDHFDYDLHVLFGKDTSRYSPWHWGSAIVSSYIPSRGNILDLASGHGNPYIMRAITQFKFPWTEMFKRSNFRVELIRDLLGTLKWLTTRNKLWNY